MFSAFTLALALSALLVEALIGYPAPVYAWLRHPVTWIGALIARLEQMLNRPEWPAARRKSFGVLTLLAILAAAGAVAGALTQWLGRGWLGFIVLAVLALARWLRSAACTIMSRRWPRLWSATDSRAGVKKWR